MVIGRDKKRNVFSNLHKKMYYIGVFTAGCDNFSEILSLIMRPDPTGKYFAVTFPKMVFLQICIFLQITF